MSILIVDDEPDGRELLAWVLKSAGYRNARTAESAEAARAILEEAGSHDDSPVDLILMDVSLPGMDGIEATRQFKAHSAIKDIPIIMVTGRTQPTDLEAAFEAGVIDYVTKPVNQSELLARVRSALRLKHEMDRRKDRERELLYLTYLLGESNRRLEELSLVDSLTGIANRRRFDQALDLEWRRAVRTRSWLAVLMVDIDYFKDYNDRHGHLAGDRCLQQVARTLRAALPRSIDLVARYGGEEFAVILPETGLSGAALVAEKLRRAMTELAGERPAPEAVAGVTISVGVAAACARVGSQPTDLLLAADEALYRAKRAGRDRVGVMAGELTDSSGGE